MGKGMTILHVHANAETPEFGLDMEKIIGQGELTSIGLLREGTVQGRASVSMIITLRDGTQVFAETTWALFRNAARALEQTEIARNEVEDQ